MVQATLKYEQSQYEAKFSELEGYFKLLSEHKDRMETLRSQMYDFWNDKNTQKVAEVLLEQIHQVENAMDRTKEMMIFYSKTVNIMGGASSAIQTELDNALKILNTVFGAVGSVAGAAAAGG